MTRYLIDSDILITVLRTGKNLKDLFKPHIKDEDFLLISTITEAELFAGASAQTAKEQDRINELLAKFLVVPVSSEIARIAGQLKYAYKIFLDDSFIAATAIKTNSVLVTKNLKDFQKIKEVKILSPTSPNI